MSNLAEKLSDMTPTPINDYQHESQTGDANVSEAVCFALTGVAGGSGVTSLCVQLAYEFITRTENQTSPAKVCLIDLDFENGSCSHYLDAKPGLQMEELCGDPGRMDKALLDALTTQHKSGINLIAAPNSLMGNSEVNPEIILNILDIASQNYDYMVLDVPRIWQPWTHAAIAASHNFGLITELTIPSLHMIRARLHDFNRHMANNIHIDLILSKHDRRAFRKALKVNDAEKTLGRELYAKISNDPDVVNEAINWGIPVGTVRADSRYAKDCGALADLWLKRTRQELAATL